MSVSISLRDTEVHYLLDLLREDETLLQLVEAGKKITLFDARRNPDMQMSMNRGLRSKLSRRYFGTEDLDLKTGP